MSAHRFLNLALATVIAVVLSCSYLLDGPSDIDAARDTEASVVDAKTAAAHAAKAARVATARVAP
jgi:hypothetical protein